MNGNRSMAGAWQPERGVAIAPAPTANGAQDAAPPQTMPYTCQSCTRRKVKCDKLAPICTTCRKARLECAYQAPAPRRRKRRLSDDVHDRVRKYERILHEHGLLGDATEEPLEDTVSPPTTEGEVSIRINEPETARVGKLVSGSRSTRYIDSNLWRAIGDDEIQQMSEEDDDDPLQQSEIGDAANPLTGALAGVSRNLLDLHPPHETAKILWKTYVNNVDPICRVLHTPSAGIAVDEAARNPERISKSMECLLFAVYHFAVVSMTEERCLATFNESQSIVLSRFRAGASQAFVNAGFLRSADLMVFQAYILFLLASRGHYDPNTFWILTGVAWRIGQRMGLHRDGEILGLPPFEVQMRRRLFWQLLPMDGIAAQISGTGIAASPDTWDTKQPLNLNESQIYPGMTHQPEEQVGATDMMFCLARTEIGKFHNHTKAFMRLPGNKSANGMSNSMLEFEGLQKEVEAMEDRLERNVVRYCDIVEPVHFLTLSLCRGAMSVTKLRLRLSMAKHQEMTDEHMREIHRLAMRVIDYDITSHQNPASQGFKWHFRALFQHSALACALTSLRSPAFLTPTEIGTAWEKIGRIYDNHPEILSQKRALHIAMRRMTLKAWIASAHVAGIDVDPPYIITLKSLRDNEELKKKGKKPTLESTSATTASITGDGAGTGLSSDNQSILDGLQSDGLNIESDFSLDTMDWMYWDRLMQDFQAKPAPNF